MKRYLIPLTILLLLAAACSRPRTVQRTEVLMGTQVSITVVALSDEQGEADIEAGMAEVRRLDTLLSLYKESSEISRANNAAGTHPVQVSPETIEVIERALEVSKLSDGLFDVTVGPLVVLWQMRLKEGRVPSDDEIARVRRLVNYRNIAIDRKASTLFLKERGMIVDLGGMKGYIADRAADALKRRGVRNALIALGGDIWALGTREDGRPWRVGVQHPRDKDRTITVLELSDKYVCTSGDYERFVIREKKRYHHIIDPRSGRPSAGVISATLIGERGSFIDPLAKVPFILGPEKGMAFVKRLGIDAIIVDEQGAVLTTEGIVLH